MREAEIAWAAGLFEGEGCITAASRRGVLTRPVMALQMTDADVVKRFHKIVGVGNVTIQSRRGKKYQRIWHWQAGAINDVRYVVELFTPWLGERRMARAQELFRAYEAAPIRRALPRTRGVAHARV